MHDLNEELIELRVDVDKNYSNTGKWVEYVNKLINHGYHDEALEAIQEACTINSSSPELFVIYIKLLKELKQKEKSRYLIADCAQNFPNNFTLQLLYGESLKQQKQFEGAQQQLKLWRNRITIYVRRTVFLFSCFNILFYVQLTTSRPNSTAAPQP